MTFEAVGPEFAGGLEMEPEADTPETRAVYANAGVQFDPNLWTRTPNLTPHPSGVLDDLGSLGGWIARFRAGRLIPQSPMHWAPSRA